MKEKRQRRWRKLDNAAQAFPAAAGKKDSRVFRFYCVLKETVDADTLQRALDLTMEKYPLFRSVLRKGLFWFYMEPRELPALVREEDRPPCSRIYVPDQKRLLFEVTYYKNRINLEVFHGLTDGTGAMQFLKELVRNYLTLTYPGHDYIPFASLSDRFLMNSVTCSSPSKAFNIAGLEIANIMAADSSVRGRIKEAMKQSELDHINSFGPDALIAAYTEGEEWLAELCRYIYDNYLYLVSYISGHLPGYRVLPLEGTYLAWMDISRSGMKSDALAERILQDGKVMVNPGTMYGPGGEDFLRINLACPRKLLEEGLGRMCRTILGL